jgi:hypothetical protein
VAASKPAVFAASSTGAIPVSEIYSENVDPAFAEWLTLQLRVKTDLGVFETLERKSIKIPRATITDADEGLYYSMDGVRVRWHRVEAVSENVFVRISFDRLHLRCEPPTCRTIRDTLFAPGAGH